MTAVYALPVLPDLFRPATDPRGDLATSFAWLTPRCANAVVPPLGCEVAEPTARIQVLVDEAIAVMQTRHRAHPLVASCISTLAYVPGEDTGPPTFWLPAVPRCLAVSARAATWLAPGAETRLASPRIVAENLYRAAVERAFDLRLLDGDLLPPGSTLAPALRAATVYAHLLPWRLAELHDAAVAADERDAVERAMLLVGPQVGAPLTALHEQLSDLPLAGRAFVHHVLDVLVPCLG